MAQLGTLIISLLQMFLSTFFPLYKNPFFFFPTSGGFNHLMENVRWDLLIAPQTKESKRPQERVKTQVWVGLISIYQQTDFKGNVSRSLLIKRRVCVMSLPLIFTLRDFRG